MTMEGTAESGRSARSICKTTMKTARDFIRMGVEFFHEEGTLCCASPDEIVPELVEEVARRTALMVPHIPVTGTIPIIEIAEFEEKRWSVCMTCGDPMASYAGGMCSLCILALRKGIEKVGWRSDVASVSSRVDHAETKPPVELPTGKTVIMTSPPAVVSAPTLMSSLTSATSPAKPPPPERHKCHAIGCKQIVPPRYLMCGPHWGMVSSDLQQWVWRTYVEGQEERKDPTDEYMEAQAAAVMYVAKKEGKLPKGETAVVQTGIVPVPISAPAPIAAPAIPPNEYLVYVEAIDRDRKSAYCVIVTRGKDSFDIAASLPGTSFQQDAICEGFVQALDLIAEKDPVAICAGNATLWSIVTGAQAWAQESESVKKARAAWKKMSVYRAGRQTRIFRYDEDTKTAVAKARKLAYLEAFPGEIFAPVQLPSSD